MDYSFLKSTRYKPDPIVDVPRGDKFLASLCIDYLNMACFHGGSQDIAALVPGGCFAFIDYAVPHWLRHLEDALVKAQEQQELLSDLPESVESFLNIHFKPPTKKFSVSQGNVKRLDFFREYPFYDDLQVAVISTRKELTFFGEIKESETALDLAEIVCKIRGIIETIYTSLPSAEDKAKMERIYGQRIFKCPRLSCFYFYGGFGTADQRAQHGDKHLRPFRCTVVGCPLSTLGMSTAKDLQKHLKDEHYILSDDELDFSDYETKKQTARVPSPPRQRKEPEVPRARRQKTTEFSCPYCHKVFNKKYNLDSHLITHSKHRDYICNICEVTFARDNDRIRHESSHGDKAFSCGGILQCGQPWGCQKQFARADTLQSHYKTATGQNCIRRWLQEQPQPGEGSDVNRII